MDDVEFRKACEKLGITVQQSAEVLSLSEKQVYRYANGRAPVPESIAKLLRAMIRLRTTDV
jgi:transcriptional regulator with XRE-family HTH domain